MHSIILTVHNKDWLIGKVIDGIINNTKPPYELIVVLDGCSDNSQDVVWDKLTQTSVDWKLLYAPDVFETKANNIGLKVASGDRVIIIQDDIIVNEKNWNIRLEKPFKEFDDVFAVTGNTAHNWIFNPNSIHLGMDEDLDCCWCDILHHVDHASKVHILPRNMFAVRCTANRGPLMLDHSDLQKLNYLDEEFAPQDMDDHDLSYRAFKQLGKVAGAYWIDYISDNSWGGTRISGEPAPWLLKAHHKNTKLFFNRYKDLINNRRIIDNRILSE